MHKHTNMICANGSAGIGIGMNVLFPEWKNFGKEDMLDAMHNLGINVICVEFEATALIRKLRRSWIRLLKSILIRGMILMRYLHLITAR